MTCTVAYLTWIIGFMPPPGTVITIPKDTASQYSSGVQAKAMRCAARYKITLEVAK